MSALVACPNTLSKLKRRRRQPARSPSAANAKLEKAVKSMFAQDEQVGRADLTVRADVTKNEVTLSGMVESEAVRSRAIELAKTAHAGVVVNDKMTVMPRR